MSAPLYDFNQLLRALQEHPEWRAELRRLVLTDELLSLPELVRELAQAQRRTEQRLEELAQAQRRTEQRLEELAQAQRRTEEALAQLARRVDHLSSQVGDLRGEAVERRYRERAHAYFGSILARLRVLPPQELADLLDAAVEEGRVTPQERQSLLWADVVVSGKDPSGSSVAMVVEVSATVSQRDVDRARERAAILARTLRLPAWAAVAGEGLAEGIHSYAERAGVWQVLDGRVLPPQQQ